MFKLAMTSPIRPMSYRLSHSINDEMWTPSAVLALDESIYRNTGFQTGEGKCLRFSSSLQCMHDSLADAIQKFRITHLESQIVGKNAPFLKNLDLFKKLGKRASWCAMSWLHEIVKRYPSGRRP